MERDVHTEQGKNELAHRVAMSFEMKEVPLIVATRRDQETFIPWMANLLGGRTIRSWDAYPVTQFIESLDRLDYVFLRFEGEVNDDLYLLGRDYALDRNAPLITRLGSHSIHPDHRLAIFVDSITWSKFAEDLAGLLSRACTLVYQSLDESPDNQKQTEPRVFESVKEAVLWCDRYYGNGHFLFRGQARDWPLTASIHRLSNEAEHAREAKRTLDFIGWMIGDNKLLERTRLSEDQAAAVAQHHRLKTALVDVSRNARVGAFFATHGPDVEPNGEGILYVFHEGDLRRYMNLEGELGERLGRGLLEPKIEALRRIRHQQGLFFESRPWLIQDLILAKLRFRQNPRGIGISEGFAPPREFIYPPPSSLERVVETYLLIEEVIGIPAGEIDTAQRPPDPSFDSAAFAARAFLDELEPRPPLPLRHPHQTLDLYAGILALTCSHLLAHQALYLSALLEAGRLLRGGTLTPELFGELKKRLISLQTHLSKGRPTKIADVPDLSIRDLVDGLAIYHDIRSGNPEVGPAQFNHALLTNYRRLRKAYACAEHWLGDLAWEGFPIAAAFALNCRDPVRSFLDAIVEIGKRGGDFLARYGAKQQAQILAEWAGHDPISIDALMQQIPLPIFHRRAIDRFEAWQKKYPDRVADLGPFLFKQEDTETARELMPQLTLNKDFEVRALQHDADLAEMVYPLSAEISILEGLVGLESTMRCNLEECPFHRFRVCGRIPSIPPEPESCAHRRNLEEQYMLTPERLEAFSRGLEPAPESPSLTVQTAADIRSKK